MRLRVVGKSRSFANELEEKVRGIAALSDLASEWSPQSTLDQQIALKVGELDRLRDLRAEHQESLLRVECYTNTELMGMEQRTPRYSPSRFPEREKLQRRLVRIERERRSLSMSLHEKENELLGDLLGLVQRHAQAEE